MAITNAVYDGRELLSSRDRQALEDAEAQLEYERSLLRDAAEELTIALTCQPGMAMTSRINYDMAQQAFYLANREVQKYLIVARNLIDDEFAQERYQAECATRDGRDTTGCGGPSTRTTTADVIPRSR